MNDGHSYPIMEDIFVHLSALNLVMRRHKYISEIVRQKYTYLKVPVLGRRDDGIPLTVALGRKLKFSSEAPLPGTSTTSSSPKSGTKKSSNVLPSHCGGHLHLGLFTAVLHIVGKPKELKIFELTAFVERQASAICSIPLATFSAETLGRDARIYFSSFSDSRLLFERLRSRVSPCF